MTSAIEELPPGAGTRADPVAASASSASWRTLALITLGYIVYNIDKNILSVLIEPIKHEFGLSDSTVGTLSGLAMIVPFAIATIPLGMLADRVSRKWLLIVLLVGWSLSVGLGGLAAGVLLLFIARMGVGLFESGFNPISLSMLNDLFPRTRRSTAMGLYSLGAPAGMFVAMALGGIIAHAYGWRAAFLVACLAGLVVAGVLAALMPDVPRKAADEGALGVAGFARVLGAFRRNRPLLHTGIGMAWCTVVVASLAIWSPSFLIRIFGLDTHEAGLSSALVVGVCGALGASGAGVMADRLALRGEWRRLDIALTGIVLSVVCGALAFLAGTSLAMVLTLLGMTAFFAQFYIGIGNTLIASHAPDSDRAGTLSVLTLAFNILGFGLGPTLVGAISDAALPLAGTRSIAWGMSATLLFSLVGAAHFIVARRAIRDAGDPSTV